MINKSNFRSFLIGGPGGVRLNTDSVANILVRFPKLLTLGSYPQTKEAVLKVTLKPIERLDQLNLKNIYLTGSQEAWGFKRRCIIPIKIYSRCQYGELQI